MTQSPYQPYGPGPVPPSGPVPPPPPDGAWEPARVDPLPGTEYALVQLQVPPGTSGLATGAMIAGIGSIVVSLLVPCFGRVGWSEGWGATVAGAFALLAVLAGGGAIALGGYARRTIRRSGRDGRLRFVGNGQAMAGIVCGATGAGIAVVCLLLFLLVQFS